MNRKELLTQKYRLKHEQQALALRAQKLKLPVQRDVTCDAPECWRTAVAFDSNEAMFVCERHQGGSEVPGAE